MRSTIAAVALVLVVSPSKGEGEQNAPRRIEPHLIPEYRTLEGPSRPSFAIVPPTLKSPLGSCTRTMQRVVWLRCLQQTADLTLHMVEQVTEQVTASINAREDAPPARKRYWLRGFEEAHENWSKLRDQECLVVASAEPNATKDTFEARLLCLIRENEQRRRDLETRFLLRASD